MTLLQLAVASSGSASPLLGPLPLIHLASRASPILNNHTGQLEAFNPITQQLIPQGPATDAGGQDFDGPAILWITFSFVIGPPMAFAGIRGWRLTTGVGLGLAAAVCSWAAIVNTMGPTGISDLFILVIVLGFFVFGFIFGLLEIGRRSGFVMVGITGGLAFGIRIFILKADLLLPVSNAYGAIWAIIALMGAINGMLLVFKKTERGGLLFACASIGTFLTFLGVDLVLNRQVGMSRGLRFLFDRNSSHIVDIISNGYSPSLLTQILLAVSLGLTPILAFAQHLIFKEPFTRRSKDEDHDDVKEGRLSPKPSRKARMREKHRSSFIIGRPSITIDEWESDTKLRDNNHR